MADASLTDQIQADLTAAMKARDAVTTSTLRMVLASIRNAEVAGTEAVTLDDAAVTKVLQSEAKRRTEAAEVYEQAGRDERAASERSELAVIERYLPAQMSNDELSFVIDEEIAKLRVADPDAELGPKSMGTVIGAVRNRVGPAADGATISALVKQRLVG